MKALVVTYTGNNFNQAIEEARRRHPEHRGALIVVPAGRLGRLLRIDTEVTEYRHEQAQLLDVTM